MNDIPKRPTREEPQTTLFEIEPGWIDEWWGMPSFEMGDARGQYKITIHFMTAEDVIEFAKVTGLSVTTRSDTAWFPQQERLKGEFFFGGPKTPSRYPVCIPSKGRAEIATTGRLLDDLGVEHLYFVEETEADSYRCMFGSSRVVVLPFHDLGQGSIPARNAIWEWAISNGHKRHWVVDDNITTFTRMTNNRRICVRGGGFFAAMEDFVDRYQNIGLAGPHDQGFVKDRGDVRKPYILNTRVYSCILVDSSLKHRWRGRYNEDTDLSIRVLKDGMCTLLFHSFLMNKPATVGSKGVAMPGGNTDHVYNTGDSRRAFAESLNEQHPDCVKVVWKFNRWHHEVDYSRFKSNRLVKRAGLVPIGAFNEYGMEIQRRV